MAISEQKPDIRLLIAIVGLTSITLTTDLLIPQGIAVPMVYVGAVLITLWIPNRAFTIGMAVTATVLTILGYYASPAGGILWMVLVNRGLAIAVIWLTTTLVLLHKKAREDIKTLRGWLAMCASCKKIRDDQGFWKGLEHYIEEHAEVLFTHSLCPSCTQKWYPELYPQLVERHPEIYSDQE
jgi:hypothetical protein